VASRQWAVASESEGREITPHLPRPTPRARIADSRVQFFSSSLELQTQLLTRAEYVLEAAVVLSLVFHVLEHERNLGGQGGQPFEVGLVIESPCSVPVGSEWAVAVGVTGSETIAIVLDRECLVTSLPGHGPDGVGRGPSQAAYPVQRTTGEHNQHYQTQERAGGYRGCLVIAILRCGTGDTETPGPAKCQKEASARVNQNSWPVDKTRTIPCPLRVQSAKVWAAPPLASSANTVRHEFCARGLA